MTSSKGGVIHQCWIIKIIEEQNDGLWFTLVVTP